MRADPDWVAETQVTWITPHLALEPLRAKRELSALLRQETTGADQVGKTWVITLGRLVKLRKVVGRLIQLSLPTGVLPGC